MMKQIFNSLKTVSKTAMLILALLCAVVQGAWADAGDTADNPITISSESDWNTFASNVNSGNSYSGKFVKLTADITVSEMVGTSSNKFQGTFLGDGVHTLTFNKGTAESAFNEQYCAPFRYTNGATIRDLKVVGDIYTSSKFAAGLVSSCNGTTTITNCHVSTVIHSSVSGDGTHGGIVAMPSNTLNITGCVYDGRMFTTSGTTQCGGFVGWHNAATNNITNSLYAPNPNITPATGEVAITTECATFVRGGNPNITNCYYTETMGTAQGLQPYTSAPANEISYQITINNTPYYVPCTISGVSEKYYYTGSEISVVPTVTYFDTPLTLGTDYTYSISPTTVQDVGYYTMTVTAQGSAYSGSKVLKFYVRDPNDPSVITDETTILSSTVGTYYVRYNVTIPSRITISGNVVLNLDEGNTLTAPKGIEVSEGNSLTINGPGTLTIDGCDNHMSGIGAVQVGTLTINGGTINVKGGYMAAGIGGNQNNTKGGSITINGGVVNATGGQLGAGIGGGYAGVYGYGVCGNIVINGGQVTAIGGAGLDSEKYAAGIGPGWAFTSSSNSGTLTLGWTTLDDFVYSSSYNTVNGHNDSNTLNSITFVEGKSFVLDGTSTVATAENIGGRTIVPYHYDGNYAIADANPYTNTAYLPVTSATYTKTLVGDRVGKYQPWLVPFDYTITDDDLLKFTFYKINMIANAPNPQTNATDQMWVFLKQMSGTTSCSMCRN